ncbi:ribosome small subunit-dependent GTPase A [Sulfitobacter sp. D35]|uniref:ribosome small subunit-dependent GTPase A n=1 Tax=Sulfitobacter sp. D35 TaxID=3083252 RepID=UPI00296F0180|nr:ribosome small subunit-dependent GTPase A [Sulfitobacter sp. D35]MDW4497242.1 ribosome small subunit-dependent GTPase A [Sulfitobacter sp. D35]
MTDFSLSDLGWSDHRARALEPGETGRPARITSVHRNRAEALGEAGALDLSLPDGAPLAVGDWVLQDGTRILSVLPRDTQLGRKAAGREHRDQLIAANVDTLGIVTSCNDDFREARVERYLALAAQSGCLPLVVLTKADTCPDPATYRRAAERLSPLVTALTLDARQPDEARRLDPWCRGGQTLALVGMSGVGKTTLQNALTATEEATQGIREADARGRHTTTARALRRTLAGGWLIDTPGMRELGLVDAAEGIDEVFSDIGTLAGECRFRDCGHESEPGCAVQEAVRRGELDPERLRRWRKLLREDQINSETVAEARARQRGLQKLYDEGARRGRDKRR